MTISMYPYRFGKKEKRTDERTFQFADYLTAELPPPAATYSILPRIYQNLQVATPSALFPMDGNDRYGDCTIAGLAHAVTAYQGLIGKKSVATAKSVIFQYLWLTHGFDSGLDELSVLKYWRKHVVFGDRLFAFASIDPKDHTHVMQAVQFFGGVYLGFQVQEDAIADFAAGRPWTPGALTQDGHAVFAVGYDAAQITTLTWGGTQPGTWSWWDETVDECYALLPPEAQQAAFTPGFDFRQLQADLRAL